MNDLTMCYKEAVKIIKNVGVKDFLPPKKISWSNARNFYGKCHAQRLRSTLTDEVSFETTITVSNLLKNAPYESLLSTIIHECLHSTKKCLETRCGHEGTWEYYKIITNNYLRANNYNCIIATTSTPEEKGIDINNNALAYTAICSCCGKKIGRVGYKIPLWYKRLTKNYTIHTNCGGQWVVQKPVLLTTLINNQKHITKSEA
jgi:hypothetical protein